MKQKLALSCALVHRPELLILDEPTTGVDAVSRREFWDLLAQLKTSGLPIVVSTPYMDEANRCDRVALIHKGKILDVDAPAAISARYPLPLLAVRATAERYRLIRALRAFPHAYAVHPFGEDAHYTDARREAEPAAIGAELRDFLRRERFEGATVTPIPAGIEDSFMALMGEGSGQRAAGSASVVGTTSA
jgi:ABC-type multidrug transport system ATPase subunit